MKRQGQTLPDVVMMVQMSPERWQSFLNVFGDMIGADWATRPASDAEKKTMVNMLASMANALAKLADQNPYSKAPDASIRALAFTGKIGGFQFYSAQQN